MLAANYFGVAGSAANGAGVANPTNRTNFGDSHRVEFVGFFYF